MVKKQELNESMIANELEPFEPPDFVIVSPKKYKSSNISWQECKKSGLFSYRGSSLLFYPSFCASPNATRIILDYQAFTSMS